MRNIKYRQYLKKEFQRGNDVFHYWGYIDGAFVSPVGKNYTDEDSQQFTGLKDINGVEIYESDIVESECYSQGAWFGRPQPRTKYVIKYSDYSGRFCFKQTDRQGDSNSMKVIGNIHQSPDLLNG